jgi:hypothetical protein
MTPPLDAATYDAPPPSMIPANPDYVPAYVIAPATWRYDVDQTTGQSRAIYAGEVQGTTLPPGSNSAGYATTAYVDAAVSASTAGVATWNGRSGTVTLTTADIIAANGAPNASPLFTGTPRATFTPLPGDNSQSLATTAFVTGAVTAAAGVASFNGRLGAVTLTTSDVTSAGGAPLASPALTGTPTAPTALTGAATGQIATTQFVANTIAAGAVVSWQGRHGAVTMTLADLTSVGGAPLASPAFTGAPTAPTATAGTATGQLATCAFVTDAVIGATTGVATWNGRSGAVTLALADIVAAGGAPLLSPALTGTPTAPTATAGTATGQLATTAFVANAVASTAGVASFNGRTGTVALQLADVTSVGGAPLASPALSGTPTAPTAPPGTNTTQLATTAYVATTFAPLVSPTLTGAPIAPTPAVGDNSARLATTGFVRASFAPIASPAFTGAPTAPIFTTANGLYATADQSLGLYDDGNGNRVMQFEADTFWSYSPGNGLGWNTSQGTVVSISDDGSIGTDAGIYCGPLGADSANVTGNVSAGGTVFGRQGVYANGDSTLAMVDNGTSRAVSFAAGWGWIWDPTTGTLAWETANSTSATLWVLSQYETSPNAAYNPASWVGGNGAYVNVSDVRMKQDVEPAMVGLAEILQLQPINFTRIPPTGADTLPVQRVEIGFSAQQVASVIPEAVQSIAIVRPDGGGGSGEADPTLGVQDTPIMVALVNAVKTLEARLAVLEGMGRAHPLVY